jgi:hypothetical protein
MSSSNSSEMDNQIVMAFSCVMNEDMSIIKVEKVAVAAASSSTRRPKSHRRYVNRDHEVAYVRLWHD